MKASIKTLFALMPFLFFATVVRAQDQFREPDIFTDRQLHLLEFEMGVGRNFAHRWDGGMKATNGTNFLVEMRLNRPAPFDLGLQLKMGTFSHQNSDAVKVKSMFTRPTLFFDYNRRVDTNTAFFAGIGLGTSFIENEAYLPIGSDIGLLFRGDKSSWAVTPRVGVALFGGGLRLTAEWVITESDYSCFDLNVGFVIGGSYKKTPAQKRNRERAFPLF